MVALVCATMSFAQSQIATLSHGDDIKTFYGPSGFKSAMRAAEHGDIITLSSGRFEASNITTAVTLRGTGMVEHNDSTGFHASTYIQGSTTVSIADSIQDRLTIEGVRFGNFTYTGTLKNPIFTKCNFYSIGYTSSHGTIQNATLINCRISNDFDIYANSSATCINCVVRSPRTYSSNINTSFEFINCIITDIDTRSYGLDYSTFKNCFLNWEENSTTSTHYSLNSTCNISNCYSSFAYAFDNSSNPTNQLVNESEVFASYEGGKWSDSEKFILKEDAAAKYLGDDDTQMGIYGGNMPYEERISMPQITKCNVAGRSTADGKLSVDIQVEAAQ